MEVQLHLNANKLTRPTQSVSAVNSTIDNEVYVLTINGYMIGTYSPMRNTRKDHRNSRKMNKNVWLIRRSERDSYDRKTAGISFTRKSMLEERWVRF
ncbi:MAG: hypothetical protein KKH98_15630 [Spirochaetes bacterium]|nr:hypothetical protein [Spirochaetota bacterium]